MFPLPLVGASEISAFASLTHEKVLPGIELVGV